MSETTGLMDEHQPKDMNTSGPVDYQPSAEERKLIKMVECLFEKAKRARSLYDQDWLDHYHLFRGKQWKEHRPSYRHSEVVNFIFRTIQSTVPMQVDARPRFEFLPEEPSDYELSQILNEVAEADWQKENWQEQLLEVVYDANFYGTGLSEVCFEPKANLGVGKVLYQSEDPFYTFPDPNARDVNKECQYFIVAKPTDVAKIKRDYPDKKDYIKPDLLDLMKGSKTDFAPLKFRSPVDRKVVLEGSQSLDLVDKEKALLITCYMTPESCEDDYEEIEKTLRDPEGGPDQVEYEQRARWPKGRKVVICNGVLLDGESTLYDDAKIPLQRYVNYLLPREFWGISEVEQLKGPQRMFNKTFCFALDVLTLMGNPIWKVPTTSGVDPENMMNRPGLVVEYDGERPPEREQGVQLQPYVLQIADKLAEYIDSISGSQDVSRGIQPTGVTAASAITALQEAANTRVRLKAKLLDGYLQQVGQAWLSRTFQFRSAPEIFRLTNADGASKYFRMHVEQYDKTEPMEDPATGEVVEQPTGERGTRVHYQPFEENGLEDPTKARQYETTGRFDVRVSTGSSLPFNKAEKEQRLTKLFELGIVDEEEVLKGIEYPNFAAVLQRMAQKKAEAAQAEAAANGAPAAPPPAA